jgi:hypothetical protein
VQFPRHAPSIHKSNCILLRLPERHTRETSPLHSTTFDGSVDLDHPFCSGSNARSIVLKASLICAWTCNRTETIIWEITSEAWALKLRHYKHELFNFFYYVKALMIQAASTALLLQPSIGETYQEVRSITKLQHMHCHFATVCRFTLWVCQFADNFHNLLQ